MGAFPSQPTISKSFSSFSSETFVKIACIKFIGSIALISRPKNAKYLCDIVK